MNLFFVILTFLFKDFLDGINLDPLTLTCKNNYIVLKMMFKYLLVINLILKTAVISMCKILGINSYSTCQRTNPTHSYVNMRP
jgi:hypothetical protein